MAGERRIGRFLDINALMRERDVLNEKRSKVKRKEEKKKERVQKRPGTNMYAIKNKVFFYKFNKSVIPEQTSQAKTSEPNVKRRMIEEEEAGSDSDDLMDVEDIPVNSNILLLASDLEVISPVPPDQIFEPSTSKYLSPSEVGGFEFNPEWKPSVPDPVSDVKEEEDDEIQILEPAPQNFQASSGHFDKYKTCFKRRGDLRMKDAVDSGEDNGSLEHPRIKCVTTYLRNLQKRDNLEHWTKLREQFCAQPIENDSEKDSPEIPPGRLFPLPLAPSGINQDSKSTHFKTPRDFFNPQILRNDKLHECVKIM